MRTKSKMLAILGRKSSMDPGDFRELCEELKAKKKPAKVARRSVYPCIFGELRKESKADKKSKKLAKSLVRSSMEMVEFDDEEIKVESDGSIWAMVSNTERLDNSGFPIANETAIKKYIANGLKFLSSYTSHHFEDHYSVFDDHIDDMMDVAKCFDKTRADKHISEYFNEDDEE